MERNSRLWPWKENSGDSTLAGYTRPSSAPPDQLSDLQTLGDFDSNAAAFVQYDTNVTSPDQSIWPTQSATAQEPRTAVTDRGESLQLPPDSIAERLYQIAELESRSLEPWSTAYRSQSMPCVANFANTRVSSHGQQQLSFDRTLSRAERTQPLHVDGRLCTIPPQEEPQGHSGTDIWRSGRMSDTGGDNAASPFRQDDIAFGVKALELSTNSLMIPCAPQVDLDMNQAELSSKAFKRHDWSESVHNGEYVFDNSWRQPNLDQALGVGLNSALPMLPDAEQDRNPMWGAGQHASATAALDGLVSPYSMASGEHSHSSSTGGTSSLSSSRSMPEMTLSVADAWMTGGDTDWIRNETKHSIFEQRQVSRDTANINQSSRPASFRAPLSGYAAPSGTISGAQTLTQSSSFTGQHSAEGTLGGLTRGRMEEGSIGSKRRIWYRAPNGQFASATQVLSGHPEAHGIGTGNGNGSSQGTDGIRRIRRRRKSEEVERKYRCDYDGCDKAYGTLNHLNTHRATNGHGPRLNAVGYRRADAERLRRLGETPSNVA